MFACLRYFNSDVTHCRFVERRLVQAHAAVNLSTARRSYSRVTYKGALREKRDHCRVIYVRGGLIIPPPKRRKYTGASSSRRDASSYRSKLLSPFFFARSHAVSIFNPRRTGGGVCLIFYRDAPMKFTRTMPDGVIYLTPYPQFVSSPSLSPPISASMLHITKDDCVFFFI